MTDVRLPTRRTWLAWLVGALLVPGLSLACADEPDTDAPPGTAFRDSAGVRIAENTRPAWGPGEGWIVADSPRITVGVAEGDPDLQLFGVTGARRLSDGRVVVANGGTSELRFFDTAGAHLSTVGGPGEGPGEFQQLARLHRLPADSVMTFDRANQRMSVFDPAGRFVSSFQLPQVEGLAYPRPRGGVFGDGSVLAYTEGGVAEHGVVREPGLFYRLDRGDGEPHVIGELPIRGFFAYRREPPGGEGFVMAASVLLPFEPHPWPVAAGEVFYHGEGRSVDIGVFSRSGELQRVVRYDRPPEPVTPDDVEAFLELQLSAIDDPEARRRMEAVYREVYGEVEIPSHEPAHSDLLVDADSNLWMTEYRMPGGDPPGWLVFDPEGRLLGSVDAPAGFTVEQIGADYVLGLTTDELGVERVEIRDLIKPAG